MVTGFGRRWMGISQRKGAAAATTTRERR